MAFWDILLSNTAFWVLIILIFSGAVAVGSSIPPDRTDLSEGEAFLMFLFGSLFILLIPIKGIMQPAYQSLRQDLAPPTWDTVKAAADFMVGYIEFWLVQILALLAVILVISVVLVPLLYILGQPLDIAFPIGFVITCTSLLIMYIATFFGDCSFYSINQYFQSFMFNKAGQPVALDEEFRDWFGNPCGAATIEEIENIADHPIAASKLSMHFSNVLQEKDISRQWSTIISAVVAWLSPVIVILGISLGMYTFIKRSSHKKMIFDGLVNMAHKGLTSIRRTKR